jgi:hypothetical protein
VQLRTNVKLLEVSHRFGMLWNSGFD